MFETTEIYGVFVRLLGLVYAFQFATSAPQLMAFIGRDGVEPVEHLLAAFRRDHGIIRGFFKLPTAFWFSASDTTIRTLPWIGAALGILVSSGLLGSYSWVGVLGCWFLWLSIINAEPNVFGIPWDNLLLECGLWTLLLPGLKPLPELGLVEAPHSLVHLGFVVLAFRVMFGMGIAKFRGRDERTRKNTFIFHFLEWQPMATVTALYLRALPMFCHKLLLWGLFLAEVIVPWLAFTGSDGRIIFAVSTLGLQIGIALCGNYGIFNLLMSVLTLPLLAAAPIWVMPDLSVTSLLAFCLLVGALPYVVVLDSWNQGMWAYVPTKLRERAKLLVPLARIYRPLVPFRIWNAYGIFVPRGSYPKMVPTIQMSQDGETWEDVVPRYMTNSVTQKPKRFAPYHPRLDHFIFYNHFRMSDFKIQCMMGFNPYYVHEVGLTEKIVEHLYRGNPVAQSLFAEVPFDDPAHVRVTLFAYNMNPITVAHETGVYWVREMIGCSETIERIELNESTGIQPIYNPFIFDSLEVDHGGVATYKIGDRAIPIQRHAMIPVEPSQVAPESFVYVTQQI